MPSQPIVSSEDWRTARTALLEQEKALTRELDTLRAKRRALPWERVSKDYRFESPDGTRTLADLFGANSQLITYHFMFGPGAKEGCRACALLADHFDGANQHLEHHDISLVVVSRAPMAEFQPFKQRMGWRFPWVSSADSDFNYDLGVSFGRDAEAERRQGYNYRPDATPESGEMPGLSVFFKDDDGAIFHTYSTYGRGLDLLIGAYNFLDLTPKGRNEQSSMMDWVQLHDRYAN